MKAPSSTVSDFDSRPAACARTQARNVATRGPGILSLTCLFLLSALVLGATPVQATYIHSFDSYVGGGTLSEPEALTLDQTTGDLYVVEHGSGCVSRYYGARETANDLLPHLFPATGTNKVCGFLFRTADYDGYPVANAQVGVDNSGTATEGSFYVNSAGLEEADPRITFGFDVDGNLETELTGKAPPEEWGALWPCSVAVDDEGNVYVNERYGGIHKYAHNEPVTDADYTESLESVHTACNFTFDSKGILRAFQLAGTVDRTSDDRYFTRSPYSGEGPFIRGTSSDGVFFEEVGPGEIDDARGVAIDETTGTLYVSDRPNGRVAVYGGDTAYRVDVDFSGTGLGAVSADKPPLEDCGDEGVCSAYYVPSTVVLEATPQLHSEITDWTGCDEVSPAKDECTVNIAAADRDIVANFTRIQRPVTASVAGTGTGSVSSTGEKGDIQGCGDGGPCTGPYDEGSLATFVATPTGRSTFTGWSGDCTNDSGPCEVVVEGSPSITAHFTAQHAVSIKKGGTGAGSVVSDPAGVNCGGICLGYFTDGETVTLSAIPSGHSSFTGWSGEGCSGTGTCQVPIGVSTKTVTATFAHDLPLAETGTFATFVGQRVATVSGSVNPSGGEVTSCAIEFGTTTAYGNVAPCAPSAVGNGESFVPIGANLTGLQPGTTYHYRLTATNVGGTANGADRTVRTLDDSCDTNELLCPRPVLTPPPPKCRKGLVLKKGRCVKRGKRNKKSRRRGKGARR